ncbi:MAG: leucine-rich repeat domain-containing protein [Candidatus Thorarchaeota archaeon]
MTDVVIEFQRGPRLKEVTSYKPDTTKIDLSGKGILEIDLIKAGKLSNLHIVDLSDNKLEEIDLSFLIGSENLERIDLRKNVIFRFDASLLGTFENLREFQFSENLVQSFDLSGFRGCLQLENLNLAQNHIHHINLEPLQTCSNLSELNLSNNQLNEIDLDPIKDARNLQKLDLSHNWIREVNLSALENHKALQVLDLSENPLSELDLSSLQGCTSLTFLSLDWTQIAELDLTPLSACQNLTKLGVSNNRLENIDFHPLINCSRIEVIDLSGVKAAEIDITPLFCLPALNKLGLSRITNLPLIGPPLKLKWSRGLEPFKSQTRSVDIASIIANEGTLNLTRRLQQLRKTLNPLGEFFLNAAILQAFDLSFLIGFDGDVMAILEEIDETHSYGDVQDKLKRDVSHALIEQLNSGGSTHFIDVRMSRRIPELAIITSKVLELRKQELEKVHLMAIEEDIDLLPLWEASYGFEILRALRIGRKTNSVDLERIRKEIKKIGIEINTAGTGSVEDSRIKLSEGLREYIRMHAEQIQ